MCTLYSYVNVLCNTCSMSITVALHCMKLRLKTVQVLGWVAYGFEFSVILPMTLKINLRHRGYKRLA